MHRPQPALGTRGYGQDGLSQREVEDVPARGPSEARRCMCGPFSARSCHILRLGQSSSHSVPHLHAPRTVRMRCALPAPSSHISTHTIPHTPAQNSLRQSDACRSGPPPSSHCPTSLRPPRPKPTAAARPYNPLLTTTTSLPSSRLALIFSSSNPSLLSDACRPPAQPLCQPLALVPFSP